MSPGSSPSSASSSSSPFSSSWIISKFLSKKSFQRSRFQKFSKSEGCFWSVFPPHPPRSRGSPRCGCACAVQAGRGGRTWRSKFSIMIFQIRLTLYVWHQVCPFTNFTCICFYFYWEWAELFLAPHIFTFSHPGTCSVTTCPGLGLGVPVNLVLRS